MLMSKFGPGPSVLQSMWVSSTGTLAARRGLPMAASIILAVAAALATQHGPTTAIVGAALGASVAGVVWFVQGYLAKASTEQRAADVLGWYYVRFDSSRDRSLWADGIESSEPSAPKQLNGEWARFDDLRYAVMAKVLEGSPGTAALDALEAQAAKLTGRDVERGRAAVGVVRAALAASKDQPWMDELANFAKFTRSDSRTSLRRALPRIVSAMLRYAIPAGVASGLITWVWSIIL